MYAELWLKDILTDPMMKKPCPVKSVISAGKDRGFTRKQIKDARKAAGVISVNINGEQFWYLPQEDNSGA